MFRFNRKIHSWVVLLILLFTGAVSAFGFESTRQAQYVIRDEPFSIEIGIAQTRSNLPDLTPQPLPERTISPSNSGTAINAATPSAGEPLRDDADSFSECVPDFARSSAPVYPKIAREKNWQGTVILEVDVDENGIPGSVHIQRPARHQVLNESALKAVRQWRFSPARMGSRTIPSQTRIAMRFLLTDRNNSGLSRSSQ